MQKSPMPLIPATDDVPIARLYQLYAIPLLTYVCQHVSSRSDAEDIVVEVFIAALEQKDSSLFVLNEQEQFAWLRRVAYYKAIDLYRRSARRPIVPLDATAEALEMDMQQNPDQQTLRHEEHVLLHERLGLLPEHYQTILRLRFANGLRCTEIGRLLQKSDGAVRVLLSRALNSLRKLYSKE